MVVQILFVFDDFETKCFFLFSCCSFHAKMMMMIMMMDEDDGLLWL